MDEKRGETVISDPKREQKNSCVQRRTKERKVKHQNYHKESKNVCLESSRKNSGEKKKPGSQQRIKKGHYDEGL